MNCPTGGYPTLSHNELRDFTADALSEVCSGVCTCVEPSLQTLSGETLTYSMAIAEDGARLDVSADGFWSGQHLRTFLMSRFSTQLLHRTTPLQCLHCIGNLRRRNAENMSKGSEKLRWALLYR